MNSNDVPPIYKRGDMVTDNSTKAVCTVINMFPIMGRNFYTKKQIKIGYNLIILNDSTSQSSMVHEQAVSRIPDLPKQDSPQAAVDQGADQTGPSIMERVRKEKQNVNNRVLQAGFSDSVPGFVQGYRGASVNLQVDKTRKVETGLSKAPQNRFKFKATSNQAPTLFPPGYLFNKAKKMADQGVLGLGALGDFSQAGGASQAGSSSYSGSALAKRTQPEEVIKKEIPERSETLQLVQDLLEDVSLIKPFEKSQINIHLYYSGRYQPGL